MLHRRVAGMIICPVGPDMSFLKPWQARAPFVFVDRMPGKLTADAVVQDDVGGGREAVAHLVAHGHRAVAFVGDDVVTGRPATAGVPGKPWPTQACRTPTGSSTSVRWTRRP